MAVVCSKGVSLVREPVSLILRQPHYKGDFQDRLTEGQKGIIFAIHTSLLFFVLAMTKAHFPALSAITQDELAASNASEFKS